MSKRKFPILEFRDNRIDMEEIEKELGIKLPPIYRTFISNFEPEPKKQYAYLKRSEKEKLFIDTDYRQLTTLGYSRSDKKVIAEEDDELGFLSFKTIDTLLEFCIPEEDDMQNMIFISEHESSDSLLVGIGSQNEDIVYLYSELNEEKPVEIIANNIFDFLSQCQIVENHLHQNQYEHIRKIESKNLYKNWADDFWRIME